MELRKLICTECKSHLHYMERMFFDFGVPDEFYAEYHITKAPVYFRGGIS